MLRVAMAAAAVGVVGAVTDTTSTPTSDSNYMVMQGDISYTTSATTSLGGIDGRVQMVRSAITATTSFTYSLHFADSGSAPAVGTEVTARLGRHVCAIEFTPYQDPYQCPNYILATNTNSCPSSSAVEVSIACTVDSDGACVGSFDWGIYIPETYEGQQLEDMSLFFSVGNSIFACANFDEARSLAVTDSSDPRNAADSQGNVPAAVLGEIEKDELGYTHVELELEDMTPFGAYSLQVVDAPCSTLNDEFAAGEALMSHSFTANDDGTADVAFHSAEIASASTQAIELVEGSTVIKCFALEVAQFSLQARLAAQTASDGCAAWADFYTVDEARGKGKGKGKGKKKGDTAALMALSSVMRKGKKKKGKTDDLESAFQSVDIDGTARCCIRPEAVDSASSCIGVNGKAGKCKGRQGAGLFAVSESRRAQTGLGAGIVGAVILAAGVAMHIRRRSKAQDMAPNTETDLTEKTPLTMG